MNSGNQQEFTHFTVEMNDGPHTFGYKISFEFGMMSVLMLIKQSQGSENTMYINYGFEGLRKHVI
jgi:hypothetical protein